MLQKENLEPASFKMFSKDFHTAKATKILGNRSQLWIDSLSDISISVHAAESP